MDGSIKPHMWRCEDSAVFRSSMNWKPICLHYKIFSVAILAQAIRAHKSLAWSGTPIASDEVQW